MAITIKQFNKGQSQTPYTGDGAFSKSSALDVHSQPGIARIGYSPTGYSGSGANAIADLPTQFCSYYDNTTDYGVAFVDNSENLYTFNKYDNSIVKEATDVGRFIVDYYQYLFAIDQDGNMRYAPQNDPTSWSTFQTSSAGSNVDDREYFMYKSRNDGKLYVCGMLVSNEKWNIGSLADYSGSFDPSGSDGTDYQWANNAFELPAYYRPIGINEHGDYLIIATEPLHRATEGYLTQPETVYFFWDRASSTADRIVSVPEKRMATFVRRGDFLYITGGERGNIYRLTESGFRFYTKIPFDYSNKQITIGDIGHQSATWWRDNLMVGTSSQDNLFPAGIYSVKDKKATHEILPSHGDDGSEHNVWIGGMYAQQNGTESDRFQDDSTLYYGWKQDIGGEINYGMDVVDSSNYRHTGYNCYFESLFYPLGQKLGKANINRVEVQLAKNLATGQGIKIKYRKNIDADWTTLGTKTYSNDGAFSSFILPGIKNIENIQIRVEMTTDSSSTTSPYLLAIRLI